MTQLEVIQSRHSVRQYIADKPIPQDIRKRLEDAIAQANKEGDLHLQLVCDEPQAFSSAIATYGKFRGVSNYIAILGHNDDTLDVRCGYYGEKVVLLAQELGLNSCWVGLTFKRIPNAFEIDHGERFICVIALGYGETQGVSHKSKSLSDVTDGKDFPEWFVKGVEAALLAPTAMNQQKFKFSLSPKGKVLAKSQLGFFSKVDLGIVKYHFEIGSGYKFEQL